VGFLACFLANNTTLQTLEITAAAASLSTAAVAAAASTGARTTTITNDGDQGDNGRPFLHYIAKGLLCRAPQSATTLVSLTLQEFTIPSSHIICQLLSHPVALTTLKLQSLRMTCAWNNDDGEHSNTDEPQWRPSPHLQLIVLGTTEIAPMALQGIMTKLSQLPCLIDLTMWIQYQEEKVDEEMRPPHSSRVNPENLHSKRAVESNDSMETGHCDLLRHNESNQQRQEQHHNRFDFTASLVQLVRRPTSRLQRLFFACKEKQGSARAPHRQFDLKQFCHAALRDQHHAPSLQRLAFTGIPELTLSKIEPLLETLQHHNCTLTDIPTQLWVIRHEDITGTTTDDEGRGNDNNIDHTDNPVDYHDAVQAKFQKMNYWLQLNRYGRARARDPETTREQLVDVLCRVLSSASNNNNNNSINDSQNTSKSSRAQMDPFVSHYGLLRELPSIWS